MCTVTYKFPVSPLTLQISMISDDLSGGVDGDLIDYEDDGYVAPNMSYVPEGLDEHEVIGGGENKSGGNEEDLLKGGEDDDEEEAGDESFEVSGSVHAASLRMLRKLYIRLMLTDSMKYGKRFSFLLHGNISEQALKEGVIDSFLQES